jgi:hypothetical protein
MDDITPGWRFLSIGLEGDVVDLGGVNVWDQEWAPMATSITVAHPENPSQRHAMDVFQVPGSSPPIVFAAGEFSNGVWGFYIPAVDNSVPEVPRGDSMRPTVDVYSTRGMILIVPIGPVIRAAFTPGESVRRLPESVADDDLGAAVRAALEESARLLPRVDYNRSAPEFRASGLPTKAEFKAEARLVTVGSDDGTIRIRPTENEFPRRPRGGFAGLSRNALFTLDAPSDLELGLAVRSTFAACTFSTPRVPRVRRP